ncbi:unnamed protein product [Didymodactylos carnosus]|nr:unnamed protein product [Didymodactylos carnosus]CAF3596308.1 unnamed protein product [Didymodactylos carnosus]
MGFNGGSATAANGLASLALTNTNTAAASALLTWVIIDAVRGTVTISGACSGIVVGLVVVTPAAGFIQPGWALLMGMIGSIFIYFACQLKKKYFHFDDTLDVFTCHGLGGMMGALLTGLFCQIQVNPAGFDGAFYGNPFQLWRQLCGVLTTIAFAAACTAGILLPMHFLFGIKLNPEDQAVGVDRATHGEYWHMAPGSTAHRKNDQEGIGKVNITRAENGNTNRVAIVEELLV